MNVIADTASRTGRRNFGLRAYLAGGTATSALIAGAAIVFLSLGAYVAFNGLGAGADTARKHDAVVIGSGGAPSAAAAAAAAAGRAASAVAATPAARTAAVQTRGRGAGGAASGSGAAGSSAGGTASGTASAGTTGGTADGSGSTPAGTPSGGQTGTGNTGNGTGTGTGSGGSEGVLGNAVNGVSNTASDLGVNTDTSGVQNIVEPLDETVNDTLDTVGGAVGAPNLGNTVNQTVNGATNGLLGGGDTSGVQNIVEPLDETVNHTLTVGGASAIRTSATPSSDGQRRRRLQRPAAPSAASLRSSQRSATPWSSASCWTERWWPPGTDQLPRLGRASNSSSDHSLAIRSSPRAWIRISGFGRSARPRRGGRARRATPRGRPRPLVSGRSRASPSRSPRSRCSSPAGQTAITPAIASEVAAAWIAMKPPRLEPAHADARRVDALGRGQQRARSVATSASAAGDISSLGLAVAALVVGDRRPAGRGASARRSRRGSPSASRAVHDHHSGPRGRGDREPEQKRATPGVARGAGPRGASA